MGYTVTVEPCSLDAMSFQMSVKLKCSEPYCFFSLIHIDLVIIFVILGVKNLRS